MAKIEIGTFSERLRRSLGMKGQEMVAAELSPEVSPVIVLQDNAAEMQFLQGIRLCTSGMLQGAVVAENSLFRILNAAGSGVLAVFTYFALTANRTSTLNVGYGITQAALGTAGATAVRDGRWGRPANPTTLTASRANNVAVGLDSTLMVSRVATGFIVKASRQWVLLPGESLEWGTGTTDVQLETTVDWYEKPLPALEEA